MRANHLLALVCFLGAAALLVSAGLPERAAFTGRIADGVAVAPEIGAFAPPFTAALPDGGTLRLNDLRGYPVVLNFWATWCAPCQVEMPELQALYAARHDRGLRVVAVNLRESAADVLAWRRAFALTFDLALDPRGEIAALYALRGQPSTYVIASDGKITHIFYGATTREALESALDSQF